MAEQTRRVLIVDDERPVLRAYERVLAARRGESAVPLELTLLDRSEDAPAMVKQALHDGRNFAIAFVDYNFPSGPNGIAVARVLLSLDDHLEVVLCSSLAEDLEREVADTIGPSDRLFILKKPFVPIEIRQLTDALLQKWTLRRATERQLHALLELDRIKDDLLATVNHELRTPLTSLRGFAELLLLREFPREKQQELLAVILEESLRLERLVTDLLDVQRAERGVLDYHFQDGVDLGALVGEAVRPFALDAHGRQRIDVERPSELPRVRADPGRVRQVLANLLSNAIKFSPDDPQVTVRIACEKSIVTVTVSDRGPGIPADVLSRVFERFYRVDNSATRKVGGSGLGLSLVKTIIEAHGGKVGVNSEAGRGSCFWFSLPGAAP